MRLFLKILFFIFTMIIIVGETKSSTVTNFSFGVIDNRDDRGFGDVVYGNRIETLTGETGLVTTIRLGGSIWGKMGRAGRHAQIMGNPLVQGIHGVQSAFWNSPATQFVLSALPIMPAVGAAFKGIGSGIRAISTASKMAKPITQVAAKGGQTIVGEGMKRVSMEAAKRPGSVILNNMPKFTGTADQVTSQMMTYNRQWILQQMRSGRPILNIGLDATRTTPSIFYQMEQNMMKNYLQLHPNAFQIIRL